MEIRVSGKIFGELEYENAIRALQDVFNAPYSGIWIKQFEMAMKRRVQTRFATFCNSGSSANLLAISALTSYQLKSEKLNPGNAVITLAAGFPTTVNPIFQNGLIPIFVDIDIETYNIDISELEKTLKYPNIRAIFIPHTLGLVFDIDAVITFAKENNLFVIADCCDALGGEYKDKPIESFADITTHSYYPAHIISTIEGGMVFSNNPQIAKIIRSLNSWGKDCWCNPGKDNTCGKRFSQEIPTLPSGYDHKYIFSEIGYNTKNTDIEAAIGLAQLDRLDDFIIARRHNFNSYLKFFKSYEEFFYLPKILPLSNPVPFGFPLTVKQNAPFNKQTLIRHLEKRGIHTRPLFAGNLTKQPAYQNNFYYRVGNLLISNLVASSSFWIGVWPGIADNDINYVKNVFSDFIIRKGEI